MKETIVGEYKGTLLEDGYTKIGKAIWYDTNVSTDAKTLYTFLKVHAGDKDSAFPSKDLTRKMLHWGETKYEVAKRELVDNGYITATKVRGEKGRYSHIEYYFVKTKQEKRYYKLKMLSGKKSPCLKNYGMDEKEGKMDSKPTPAMPHPHLNSYGAVEQPLVAVKGANINEYINNDDNTLSLEERELLEVLNHYKTNINKDIVDFEVETLNGFVDTYSAPLVLKAIDRTVMFLTKEKRTIAYVSSILRDLKSHNVFTADQADEYFRSYDEKKAKAAAETKQKPKGKPYYAPKPSTFNNFEQRSYNFDELEKKLLGWEQDETMTVDEKANEIYKVYEQTGSARVLQKYLDTINVK